MAFGAELYSNIKSNEMCLKSVKFLVKQLTIKHLKILLSYDIVPFLQFSLKLNFSDLPPQKRPRQIKCNEKSFDLKVFTLNEFNESER